MPSEFKTFKHSKTNTGCIRYLVMYLPHDKCLGMIAKSNPADGTVWWYATPYPETDPLTTNTPRRTFKSRPECLAWLTAIHDMDSAWFNQAVKERKPGNW